MATRGVCCAVFVVVVAIWCVEQAENAAAPAVDCSTLILNMADCLSFVTNGSTSSKPEGACCSGLKTVLKVDSWCLCEAFRTSTQLGVFLNVTKALSLPDACKVSAPQATNCAATTAQAPAVSPGPSPSTGGSATPPSRMDKGKEEPSASSPRSSGSSSDTSFMSVSSGVLILGSGLVLVSFLSF